MASASDATSDGPELLLSDLADKRPVILQLVPRLDEGGVERGTLEIASAIVQAGGRAIVASAGGRLASRLTSIGGEFVEMPVQTKNVLSMRRNARRIADLVNSEKIDLIHARSRAPAWSGYWASRRTGAAFVTTYHGSYNEDFPLKRRYNAVMAKGNPTIAVSDFIAQMIRERHGLLDDRIMTIPRGADLSVFDPQAMKGERIAQLADRWGLTDETRPILLLPGRLTRWKGQEVFIDACALLREKRGPDFLGLMIGGAPDGSSYPDDLEKRAREKGCTDVIKIAGSCNDMPAAYRLAGCAVSASTDPEAFGRVAVEAQAMGRPIIATNHGGSRETVDDGITGALVEPGNAAKMAEAMDAFLELDEATCDRIGKLARLRVQRLFSTARMQASTLDVYERATGLVFPAR